MDRTQLRDAVLSTLTQIAPEVDAASLQGDVPLRRQIDLDSMDWLNVLLGLHQKVGVDIPEADYRKLTTIDVIVEYLAAKLGG